MNNDFHVNNSNEKESVDCKAKEKKIVETLMIKSTLTKSNAQRNATQRNAKKMNDAFDDIESQRSTNEARRGEARDASVKSKFILIR